MYLFVFLVEPRNSTESLPKTLSRLGNDDGWRPRKVNRYSDYNS